MKNNDISNKKAPSILIMVDNFLVVPKEDTLADKVLSKFNKPRYAIDKRVAQSIQRAFTHTNYHVGLAVTETMWSKYSTKLRNEIIDLPIGDIHVVEDPTEIKLLLESGEYLYFVDDNATSRLRVGSSLCLTLESLNYLLMHERRRYTHE